MRVPVQYDCVLDKQDTSHIKRDLKLIRFKKIIESSIEDYGITTIK